MSYPRLTWIARIVLAGAFALSVVPPLSAQESATPPGSPEATPGASVSLVLHPADAAERSFFDVEMKPGEQRTLTAVVGTDGTSEVPVRLYAADAYTIRNGGFGVEDSTTEPTGVTTWLDFPTEELVLQPGGRVTRDFTITVPADAVPGEYMTGLAVETATPLDDEAGEGTFQVEYQLRAARAVRIVVPGPVEPAFAIGDVSVDYSPATIAIVVGISNSGNIRLNLAGTVQIMDGAGTVVAASPIQMGTVYAWNDTTIWLPVGPAFPPGDFTISLSLADDTYGLEQEIVDVPFAVDPAAGAPTTPITITAASVTPAPAADNVQFAMIDAVVNNIGEPVANAQLSLIASVNGEEIERFPISQALSLVNGDTPISMRYIPATGWTSGEWTFELLLETVDPSGAVVVVGQQPIEGTIRIP